MQHIILIGFKNAGKSTIGQALAEELGRPFLDLDEKIREEHQAQSGEKIRLSCRTIMEKHGEAQFRKLEHEVLAKVIQSTEPLVLAVGGGTPMAGENRELLGEHTLVHVSAPENIVFERMMINGKPAFMPKNEPTLDGFRKVWNERQPVYKKLADITVESTGSVDKAVAELKTELAEYFARPVSSGTP